MSFAFAYLLKQNNRYLDNFTIVFIDTRQARSATLRKVSQYHIDMPCANIKYVYGPLRNNNITSVFIHNTVFTHAVAYYFSLHLSGFTMSQLEIDALLRNNHCHKTRIVHNG